MAYYEKDNKGELVPIKGGVETEAMAAIEKYDDEAIVREMTGGAAAEEFIYRYNIQTANGPHEVIGISTPGASQLANLVGNLEVLNDVRVDKDSDPDYIYAMLRVRNSERNTVLLGVGRACKYVVGRNNAPVHDRSDEHAFVKAISKAQRNGILHHVSEEVITRIINTWAKSGKQARINPPTMSTERKAAAPKQNAPGAPPVTQKQESTASQQSSTSDIAKQMEKLNTLRELVHNRFSYELKLDDSAITPVIEQRFGAGKNLSSMSEKQLNDCLAYIDEIIAKRDADDVAVQETGDNKPSTTQQAKVTQETPEGQAIALGFTTAAEQFAMRDKLFKILTGSAGLGMSPEQARKWVSGYNIVTTPGLTATACASKDTITTMINDAEQAAGALHGNSGEPGDQGQLI